jgi:ribosome-binding ATPase YchF (GTP1/OBG family)
MRNKELIVKKLETVERTFTQLEHMVKRQSSVKEFVQTIEKGNSLLEQVQSLLELEN